MAFLRKYWILVALLLATVLCAWLASRIVNAVDYHHTDNDFFTFWLAGHLVAQGGNPYDAIQWTAGYHQFDMAVIPNQAFLYPLPLALLLVPLGLFSFHTAYIVWVTLLQLMILAAVFILLSNRAGARARLFIIPMLAGIIFFRPTILTLFQGQVSGLFLLLLVLAAYLWQKEKWAWGGVLLGLFALKPNLGAPLLLLSAIWLISRKRWKALLGALGCGVFLLAAGLVYNPGWPGQYWQVGNHKLAETFGGSPTVWGLGALACRNGSTCTLALGGIAALLLLLGFLWLVLRHPDLPPVTVIALAVTLTLLVTPYTWTYDQLLLILPVTAVILVMDKLKVNYLVPASLFIVLDGIAVILLVFDTQLCVEILNAILPLLVFALLGWAASRRLLD